MAIATPQPGSHEHGPGQAHDQDHLEPGQGRHGQRGTGEGVARPAGADRQAGDQAAHEGPHHGIAEGHILDERLRADHRHRAKGCCGDPPEAPGQDHAQSEHRDDQPRDRTPVAGQVVEDPVDDGQQRLGRGGDERFQVAALENAIEVDDRGRGVEAHLARTHRHDQVERASTGCQEQDDIGAQDGPWGREVWLVGGHRRSIRTGVRPTAAHRARLAHGVDGSASILVIHHSRAGSAATGAIVAWPTTRTT